jgi:hypothetical protein
MLQLPAGGPSHIIVFFYYADSCFFLFLFLLQAERGSSLVISTVSLTLACAKSAQHTLCTERLTHPPVLFCAAEWVVVAEATD